MGQVVQTVGMVLEDLVVLVVSVVQELQAGVNGRQIQNLPLNPAQAHGTLGTVTRKPPPSLKQLLVMLVQRHGLLGILRAHSL